MNRIKNMLAAGLLLSVLLAAWWGISAAYDAVAIEWSRVADGWRTAASGALMLALVFALLVSVGLRAAIRRETSRSIGRVDAYNSFVAWYSALRNSGDAPDASTLAPSRNGIILWGAPRVVSQLNSLHALLKNSGCEYAAILEKAEHVFIEIKRDIGHRAIGTDRTII